MIALRSEEELKHLRVAGRVAAETLWELRKIIAPGIITKQLDEFAENLIRARGAEPAFKGYRGFPSSLCVSINEQVVHGLPGPRPLQSGDIVSIDLGAKLDGFYGDGAFTIAVDNVNEKIKTLLEVTEKALYEGISQARIGNRVSDISHAIQCCAERSGFSVVRDFTGHGIGTNLHEEPQIPNFGEPHRGPRLKKGMVLAVEPMVNMGTYKVEVMEDNWTVVTKDHNPSAHFEHTIAITDGKAEILTQLEEPGI